MIIDGVFKTLPEQVEKYQNLLKSRLHKDSNGGVIIVWLSVGFFSYKKF